MEPSKKIRTRPKEVAPVPIVINDRSQGILIWAEPLSSWTSGEYQNRFVYTTAAPVVVVIAFDRPADGTEQFSIAYTGTAVAGTHYSTDTPAGTISPSAGQASVEVVLTPLNNDDWYAGIKTVSLELTAVTNSRIWRARNRVQLEIMCGKQPPTIEFSAASSTVASTGTVNVGVVLSEACSEDVSILYRAESSNPSDLTVVASGSVTIPAGSTTANVEVEAAAATVGDEIILVLDHPSNEVEFTFPANASFVNSNPQVVHRGENLMFLTAPLGEFEYGPPNPPADGAFLGARPTGRLPGGATVSLEPRLPNEWVSQAALGAASPTEDSVHGGAIPAYRPSEYAESVGYLRDSFGSDICGGPQNLRPCKPWAQVVVKLAPWPEDIELLGTLFFAVFYRSRLEAINHGVIFRVGTLGLNRAGAVVPVLECGGVFFHEWIRQDMHPEDEIAVVTCPVYGQFIRLLHRTDGTYAYSGGQVVNLDTSYGLPILYPVYGSPYDGTLELNGGIDGIRHKIGVLMHAPGLIYSQGIPDVADFRYRPRTEITRAPEGNAVQSDSGQLEHTVTVVS